MRYSGFFPLSETRTRPDGKRALHILLVEDDMSDEMLIRGMLEDTHIACDIRSLRKGSEVVPYLLRTMKYNLPDLIMLDLGLPGVDGFDVLAAIAQLPAPIRHVPIALLTGYTEFAYLKGTLPVPVLAYLTKPCATGDLRALLVQVQNESASQ